VVSRKENPVPFKAIDLSGRRFGRLVVLRRGTKIPRRGGHSYKWLCRCDCGVEKEVLSTHLSSGHTRSCGCFQKEWRDSGTVNFKHGHWSGDNAKGGTPEHRTWMSMNARCYIPGSTSYRNYGARGITVCDRWRDDFLAFFADMGKRPSRAHSIERLKNDKGYSPENCVWALPVVQSNNRRSNRMVEINGEHLSLTQAAQKFSPVALGTVWSRLQDGWDAVDAILTGPFEKPKERAHGRL
jgi:hypothetical protein